MRISCDDESAPMQTRCSDHLREACETNAGVQHPHVNAHMLFKQVPSTFSFLGIRNETAGSVHGLHTPRFVMDESQMPLGDVLS